MPLELTAELRDASVHDRNMAKASARGRKMTAAWEAFLMAAREDYSLGLDGLSHVQLQELNSLEADMVK